jgi:hypothetical protein
MSGIFTFGRSNGRIGLAAALNKYVAYLGQRGV